MHYCKEQGGDVCVKIHDRGNGSFAKDLPDLERRVIVEWLPSSGYVYADGPDIDVLLPTNVMENAEFEIWIPVQKKV